MDWLHSRKEDVKERVGQADERPGQPDQTRGNAHLSGGEESSDVNRGLAQRKTLLRSPLDLAAGFKLLEGQRAWTVVLRSHPLKGLDDLCVLALAEEVLRRLSQSDDGDAKNGQDKYDGTASEHDVSPALVVIPSAVVHGGAIPVIVDEERPGDETSDGLTNTPPKGKE